MALRPQKASPEPTSGLCNLSSALCGPAVRAERSVASVEKALSLGKG